MYSLFFNQKLTDIEFMNLARPILFDFFNLNVRMQDLYRAWTLLDDDQQHPAGIFLDYAELPLIKQLVNFADKNDVDFLIETLDVLEDLIDARGIKDEELDVIGEIMSNMIGALEVTADIKKGVPKKEALNSFMKKVTNIGK